MLCAEGAHQYAQRCGLQVYDPQTPPAAQGPAAGSAAPREPQGPQVAPTAVRTWHRYRSMVGVDAGAGTPAAPAPIVPGHMPTPQTSTEVAGVGVQGNRMAHAYDDNTETLHDTVG